ncbi:MAG: MATE family efflux transporter, partial [Candidatus Poribacteria bacterium]|nr:MATE family efflux transporter [Candidatus Poribacteria bacterium]
IERAEKSARMGNILGTTVMAGIGVLFLVFPQMFIQIFSNDSEVIKIGSVYLQYLSLTFGFIAFSLVLGKALNGAGDTFSPMIITLAAQMGVGLGLVMLLSHFIGLKGVWLGIALSNVVQGAAMWLWYRTGRWKTIKIIKNGSENPTRKAV